MKKSKHTLRALVASLLTMAMFSAMFIGSTYAWFTDTATTGVNTIQSGTLDVDLVNEAGASLQGQQLSFKAADNRNTILWEPGCTYTLDPVYVKNNGDLAFKYKLVVNGVDGNAKLLEAIEWKIDIGTTENVDLSTFEGNLLPAAGASTGLSDAIVISGHMKETAGNEYQGLSITGLGITVYATQYTYEYDSIDNQYDEDADLGMIPVVARASVQDSNAVFSAPTAPADDKSTSVAITAVDAADGDDVILNVDVDNFDAAQTTFAVEDNHTAVAGIDLSLTDTSGQKVTFDEGVATITTYILPGLDAANLSVKYNGDGAAPTLVSYNAETGKLVFTTTHFSSYFVDYNGTFAYVPQLNCAFTGFDCGGEALDAISIYAENSVAGLSDAFDIEAMTEFYNEEAFPADAHTVIMVALIGGCNGYSPSHVEDWVMDFANGKTEAEVVQMAQQYFNAYKACVDATQFYPIEEGSISAWAPWPMGVSIASF